MVTTIDELLIERQHNIRKVVHGLYLFVPRRRLCCSVVVIEVEEDKNRISEANFNRLSVGH